MRLLGETHMPGALVPAPHHHTIDTVALQNWQGGAYRDADDATILAAAYQDERVLLTFDLKTIPACLRAWAAAGNHHAGVILVSQKTFLPNDVGSLLRTLVHLAGVSPSQDWLDRVVYLGPAPRG
jgi:hypothetical protein